MKNLNILKCRKPKNFINTNLFFDSSSSAQKYVEFIEKDFLLERAKKLEFLLSKRKKKNLSFSRPKKHLLTKVGNKFLLWQEMN